MTHHLPARSPHLFHSVEGDLPVLVRGVRDDAHDTREAELLGDRKRGTVLAAFVVVEGQHDRPLFGPLGRPQRIDTHSEGTAPRTRPDLEFPYVGEVGRPVHLARADVDTISAGGFDGPFTDEGVLDVRG
jgi:hypothetical protein